VTATWGDLILPEPVVSQLRQIAADVQMHDRGLDGWNIKPGPRGIGILFAGERGTGKTLAAQVLAHELKRALYRVDLAAVVSQYLGETEKNLGQVFDDDAAAGALLLFDEADALFGPRSEVKDAHDRYANQEVAYLLRRMETHPSLVILTTSRKAALDPAFTRRLRYFVDFPFPGVAERKRMWARAMPAEIRRVPLDLERLAHFSLSGRDIRTLALEVATRAAQSDGMVTMPLIFEAVRNAFRKLNRPINEADFHWPDDGR
jgi:SpoVK/Ycf46/Vps4 family AAA+-type ATPase